MQLQWDGERSVHEPVREGCRTRFKRLSASGMALGLLLFGGGAVSQWLGDAAAADQSGGKEDRQGQKSSDRDGYPRTQRDSKIQDLEPHREHSKGTRLTTEQGVPLSDTDDSLKAGERGPTIMEDFHFREKMTHFDHERIPERVVHARGAAAHGYFQVYKPLKEWTRAKVFQDPSKKTPVFVRLSTVVGSRGSADTVRDVRGFATKFYTEDGNWDLVGNNMPVFFIQDGIKFPDLVHAIKPVPDRDMPQASAAHDTFYDFVSLTPESAHMIMWLFSDRALPRSLRMMDGFGVHTFRFVNEQGKGRFVKFHWRPVLGTAALVFDEAQKLAGKDPDYLRRDLWMAIESGNYPEYELGVQIVEEKDEQAFGFDLLDPTKIIPESKVPVQIIGKMTLNRNPDNFFAETEQVAFHPGNVVPGIDFSNDPLLQGRLFSYLDTQLIRLGGPNFTEIPINRPLAPVHNNQRDGHMRQRINEGRVNYSPNSLDGGDPRTTSGKDGGYVHYQEKVEGKKTRARSESFKDFFSQATMFWNSLTPPEQQHLVEAAHFELGKVESKEIRHRMVHEYFNKIDHELAKRVAKGIGIEAPAKSASKPVDLKAPEVSIEHGAKKDTIKTRKIAILAAEGVDAGHVTALKQALKKAGAETEVVSQYQGMLKGADGGEVKVDKNYATTGSVVYDALYIPGGRAHVDTLKTQREAVNFVNEMYRHGKSIGATGEGVELLSAADFKGAQPGVITLSGTDLKEDRLQPFTNKFIEAVGQHRHWERDMKTRVPAS
jgi:catalase